MKTFAFIVGVLALVCGIYGVTGPGQDFRAAEHAWNHGGGAREYMDTIHLQEACQTMVEIIVPTALLGLVLGLIAVTRRRGGIELAALSMSAIGAVCAALIVSYGIF